jgi:hypothetical protein
MAFHAVQLYAIAATTDAVTALGTKLDTMIASLATIATNTTPA